MPSAFFTICPRFAHIASLLGIVETLDIGGTGDEDDTLRGDTTRVFGGTNLTNELGEPSLASQLLVGVEIVTVA